MPLVSRKENKGHSHSIVVFCPAFERPRFVRLKGRHRRGSAPMFIIYLFVVVSPLATLAFELRSVDDTGLTTG